MSKKKKIGTVYLMIQEIESCKENKLLYSPNAIAHGTKINFLPEMVLVKNEAARLNDFIEFLFEHSEHCDHISQSDAWGEFQKYEWQNSMILKKHLSETTDNEIKQQ